MSIDGISAAHIAPSGGKFEPQRKNNFTLVFPLGAKAFQLSIHSVDFPKTTTEEITIDYGNEQRFAAGKAVFPDITVVIKDFYRGPANAALRAWRKMVYNPETGAIGRAKDYKAWCTLYWMGPDGTTRRGWRLYGCWPIEITPGNFSMSEASDHKVTAKFSIDKAIKL